MALVTRTVAEYLRSASVSVTYDDGTGNLSAVTVTNTATVPVWIRVWWNNGEAVRTIEAGGSLTFSVPGNRRWWWGTAENPNVPANQIVGLECRWG